MKIKLVLLSILAVMLMGCATSGNYQLGQSLAQMKTEQTYNPDAGTENVGYVPDGQGERMEEAQAIYTGKAEGSLSGTDSQVLDSF